VTSPWPPADLDRRDPNLIRVRPGDLLHRFFSRGKDPIHFDHSDAGRLNAPDGAYGVLYAARRPQGAFAETFLRSPGRRLIDPGLMARKAYVQFEVSRPLNLIDFDGPGLAILGATAEVVHGPEPYDLSQAWSAALKAHPVGADGIAYGARHDPREVCYALFDGAPLRAAAIEADLDADWFWELADVYRIGRPPA
jgi:RES domain